MRYIFSILSIFLFTGATKSPDEKSLIFPRSFFLEMKKLEKPARVYSFSHVQTATNTQNSGTSVVVTISSTSANNLVVVSIFLLSANTISSVADNQGNTYAAAQNYVAHSSYRYAVFYGFQTTGGATTVTVSFSSTTGLAIVDEFSGFTGTPTNAECYDTSSHNEGAPFSLGTGTIDAGTFTPINNGCLIFGYGTETIGGTYITEGSGFTHTGTAVYSGTDYSKTMYKASGTMSETTPWTDTYLYQWMCIGVSFKQEDTGPPAAAGKAIRSAGN